MILHDISRSNRMFWVKPAIALIISLCLFFTSCVKTPEDSQPTTGSISGRITNVTSSQSIADAQVTTIPSSVSVLSNSTGNFTIGNLEPRQYTVYASKTGYVTASVVVNVIAGQVATGDIALTEVSPELVVSTSTLDFGSTETLMTLNLRNSTGIGTISWTANRTRNWIQLSELQGSITNQAQTITVRVLRDSLTSGNYNGLINFSSNAGNPTVQVLVTIPNPELTVSPSPLDFGTTQSALSLTVRNQTGIGSISWTASATRSWIQLSSLQGTVTNQSENVTVTISRTGLAPGNYSGAINFVSNAGNPTVQVLITIPNPTSPQLSLDVTALDFDSLTSSKQIRISNTGVSQLNWTIISNQTWLTIQPSFGSTAPSGYNTVTVGVNRAGLTTGIYNSGSLSITSNGGDINVTIQMLVRPPILALDATVLGFDSLTTAKQVRIYNRGSSSLNWSIVSNQPWLTVQPSSGSTAVAGYSVVSANVDRTGLAAGVYNNGTLTFSSNGGEIVANIQMTVLPDRPVAPSNLAAIFTTARTITLSWTDNSSNEEGFQIERRISTQPAFVSIATVTANSVSYADTGLTPHTTYYYRVCAFNQTVTSTYTNSAYATIGNIVPDQPFGPSPNDATNLACNGTLRWSGTDPDLDTLRYDVYLGNSSPIPLFVSNTTSTSAAFSGLYANTNYTWRIVAKDNYSGITNGPVWNFTTGAPIGTTFSIGISPNTNQEGRSVVQSADGGYACTGFTGTPPYDYDMWAAKYSETGTQVWSRTFGRSGYDRGNAILATPDGGFLIVGETSSYGHGNSDVWLVKLTSTGDTSWTRALGGSDQDVGWSVILSRTNEFVIAGFTYSYGNDAQLYLLKTNQAGQEIWHQTFGGVNFDAGCSVIEASDGGYVVSGVSRNTQGNASWWMIKTNSSGTYQWGNTYGSTNSGYSYSVKQTFNGDFVLTGEGYSTSGDRGLWVIRTDNSGNQLWLRQFGGTGNDFGNGIATTADGGMIVAGSTESSGAGGSDLFLVKLNAGGDSLWSRVYGGTGTDRGVTVQQTRDNGYIVIGSQTGTGSNTNIWLLKTDPNGNVAGMR